MIVRFGPEPSPSLFSARRVYPAGGCGGTTRHGRPIRKARVNDSSKRAAFSALARRTPAPYLIERVPDAAGLRPRLQQARPPGRRRRRRPRPPVLAPLPVLVLAFLPPRMTLSAAACLDAAPPYSPAPTCALQPERVSGVGKGGREREGQMEMKISPEFDIVARRGNLRP